jgi:hypothetical protein
MSLGLNHNDEMVRQMVTNSPSLLGKHVLDNGLTLELWDHSRPVAGDRWFVSLAVRIAIPVRDQMLPPELSGQAAAVLRALGEEIVFTRKEERNFIAASEAPVLLQDMHDRIMALAHSYFGRPDFAGRFIRQKFAAHQALRQWQRLDTRKMGGD